MIERTGSMGGGGGARLRRNLAGAFVAVAAGTLAGVSAAAAQTPTGELTLQDAIDVAARNNPTFLSAANDQAVANWGVRAAYSEFLPTASANGGMTYTRAGVQQLGTLATEALATDYLSSRYSISLGWSINGATLFGVSAANASADATEARIDAARYTLESAVTAQYVAVLSAQGAVEVQRRGSERARLNLDLVETRVAAGANAGWESKQAEVARGRAEVAVLQAEQALRATRLRLAEQLGVELDPTTTLTSTFDVFEPTWTAEELIGRALGAHPDVRASVAQESAARAGLRQARSSYFPSISVGTGFSGNARQARNQAYLQGQVSQAAAGRQGNYDRCLAWQDVGQELGVVFPGFAECASPILSEEDRNGILAAGDLGPYVRSPLSVSLSVSVPLFNGFGRERQNAQAQAALKDAEHQRTAQELRLRAAVTESLDALEVAYQVIGIEARNLEVAEEQLELQRQRYTAGAAGIIELLDGETTMLQAESDSLSAVYRFHQAFVALQAAAGVPLSPTP